MIKQNYKFKKIFIFLAYLLLPTILIPLTGCTFAGGGNYITTEKEDENYELYKKEGYYNRFPIQVYIDSAFSDYNKNLIVSSLNELDKTLTGITFEYVYEKSVRHRDYSTVDIVLDKNGGYDTRNAYESSTRSYAQARMLGFSSHNKHEDSFSLFNYRIEVGGFLTITEDIKKSKNLMIRPSLYDKFGAYNADGFWSFGTSYNTFRNDVKTTFKGLIKHEMVHSLGFKADNDRNCGAAGMCHSKDKTSLMYPTTIKGSGMRDNRITNDVVSFLNEKYPK